MQNQAKNDFLSIQISRDSSYLARSDYFTNKFKIRCEDNSLFGLISGT